MLTSPYIYIALFTTALASPLWLEIEDGSRPWTNLAYSIIPSMLGFSMGGMAIMLAFSDSRTFAIIAEKGKARSHFAKVIANFYHFILVQTLAIMLAMISNSYLFLPLSAFSFFVFAYAIFVGVATAGQLLNTGVVLNAAASLETKKNDD